MQEIPEEYRASLETTSIDEQLERVNRLLESSKEISSYNLGIKLALIMAKELHDGKAPGSQSSLVMRQWAEDYYPEFLEEIIKYAREFILKPNELVEEIGKRIFKN